MQLNHIGVSGGKDSTALLLWAVHESGYPRETIRASFADTGNELEVTYDYVRMLAARVHPIVWLKPERDFYELARHKKRFPSSHARFCTTELKMEPSRRYIYALLDQGYDMLLHTGVRAAESVTRAALQERDFDSWYGLPVFRPLPSWTLEDVWAIHERYGVPRNPLYALGMQRVGCAPCIMSRKSEIRRMAQLFPDRFERIRMEERRAAEAGRGMTFFAPDKIPACQRSCEVETKDGRLVQLAMIEDVVRWAQTSHGGAQYELALEDEDETMTCAQESGLCE